MSGRIVSILSLRGDFCRSSKNSEGSILPSPTSVGSGIAPLAEIACSASSFNPEPRRSVSCNPPGIDNPPSASQVNVAFSPGFPVAYNLVPAATNWGSKSIAGRRLKADRQRHYKYSFENFMVA